MRLLLIWLAIVATVPSEPFTAQHPQAQTEEVSFIPLDFFPQDICTFVAWSVRPSWSGSEQTLRGAFCPQTIAPSHPSIRASLLT